MSYRGLFASTKEERMNGLPERRLPMQNRMDHLICFIRCLICRFTEGNRKFSSCSLLDSFSYSRESSEVSVQGSTSAVQ